MLDGQSRSFSQNKREETIEVIFQSITNNRHNKYLRSILLYILHMDYQNNSATKKKIDKVSSIDGIPILNVILIPSDIHKQHDDSIHDYKLHQHHTVHMLLGIWSLYRTLGCHTRGLIHIHVCIHLMGYPKTTNIKLISYFHSNVQLLHYYTMYKYRILANIQRILLNKSKLVLSWWLHILYWCHMGLDGMLPLQIKS